MKHCCFFSHLSFISDPVPLQALILQPNWFPLLPSSHWGEKLSRCWAGPPRPFWCRCILPCQWALTTAEEAAWGSKLQAFESPLLRACLLSTKRLQVKHKTHGNDPQSLSELQSARTEGHVLPSYNSLVFPSCSSSLRPARMTLTPYWLCLPFITTFAYKSTR